MVVPPSCFDECLWFVRPVEISLMHNGRGMVPRRTATKIRFCSTCCAVHKTDRPPSTEHNARHLFLPFYRINHDVPIAAAAFASTTLAIIISVQLCAKCPVGSHCSHNLVQRRTRCFRRPGCGPILWNCGNRVGTILWQSANYGPGQY